MTKKQFEGDRKTVHQVMLDIGYTDMNAFREVFYKVTGLTPVEYKNKYSPANKN